jgi:hypothetical protein
VNTHTNKPTTQHSHKHSFKLLIADRQTDRLQTDTTIHIHATKPEDHTELGVQKAMKAITLIRIILL